MRNQHTRWGGLPLDPKFPSSWTLGDLCGDIPTLRGIEVACAGKHTLSLAIDSKRGQALAQALGQWAMRHGATVRVVPLNPAHTRNYASAIDIYRRTRKFQVALQADMWLKVAEDADQVNGSARLYCNISHLSEMQLGEFCLTPMRAPTRADFAAGSTLAQLYDAAQGFPNFAPHFERALRVAATIAALAGAPEVESIHVSEAMQYAPSVDLYPASEVAA